MWEPPERAERDDLSGFPDLWLLGLSTQIMSIQAY